MLVWRLVFLTAAIQVLRAQTPDGPWAEWNYCDQDVKCKERNQRHTVCERNHKCEPIKNCLEHTTDTFRDMMVRLHNDKRNFVATGRHGVNNVKPARNMRALSYDYPLEYTIRCHLNRCAGTEHDVCRGTQRWVQCSQNLCGHTLWDDKKSIDENIEILATLCVDLWFNESYYKGADFSNILASYDTLTVPEGKTGHFTALVWGITSHLGCHFSRDTVDRDHDEMGGPSKSNRGQYGFVGCNYGIGGNNEGRPMYQIGKACSRCPRGVDCNGEYSGLCGNIKYVSDLAVGGSDEKAEGMSTWLLVSIIVIIVSLVVGGVLIYKFVIEED